MARSMTGAEHTSVLAAPEAVGGNGLGEVSRFVPRPLVEWGTTGPTMSVELEGSLVFVDISGFTALSERLARLGRIGAEQLTDVLNRVFRTMLGLADDRGGSLLKFGGDALLLLFTGSEHAVQACAAAVEMRAALRQASERPTSAGRLRLAMSVGVDSGTVHLFRAGGSHIELLVTGPAASSVTAMEKAANAGEILVSAGTRASLPPGVPLRPREPGWLLGWRRSPVPAPGPRPAPPPAGTALVPFLPRALRPHLVEGRTEPEHRLATIGFLRFEGVDRLMADLGPPAVAAALDELVRHIQDAVDAEGVTFLGTDIDADGGKVILAAGVPSAQEDDDGRILRAVRRIVDGATRLSTRVGVHRGHVFAGEVGTSFRSAYTVMGDTVNLAARLMAAAPVGAVYATPPVLAGSRTRFDAAALAPLSVKGKAEPVHAYAIGAGIGTQEAERGAELPYTGRAPELAAVGAALDAALTGEGAVVVVVGEAGMGKTRIAQEALAGRPALAVFEIHAEAFETATPYGAVRGPIRRLLGLRGTDDEMARQLAAEIVELDPSLLPYLPLLGEAVDVTVPATPEADAIDPSFRMERVADVVERIVDRLLPAPAAIVVDDAQWLDEASTHLVGRLVDAAGRRHRAILVLRRPEPGGFHPVATTIELAPLTQTETEMLVVAATGAAPLRPHEVQAVVHRSGGHPLYLREIVLGARDATGFGDLPDSVDALISARLDRLELLPRRVLHQCAVLGRRFPRRIAEDLVASQGIHLDLATRGRLREFLDTDGDHLRFRHTLIQEVAYARLPFERRRHLHAAAGATIERHNAGDLDAVADVLGLHYAAAQDHAKAWRHASVAGHRARDAAANSDAATHYERALTAARRLAEVSDADRAALLVQLGDVREHTGSFDAAFDAYRRASRLVSGDAAATVEVLLRRARARERAGAFPSALREIAAGRRALTGVDDDAEAAGLRARLLTMTALVRQGQGRHRDALAVADQAVQAATSAGERAALARAYTVLDWAHLMLGHPAEARNGPEALAIFEELDDLLGQSTVMTTLGADAYFHGRWGDAVAWYERSRAALLRAGNTWQAAGMGVNIGEVLVNQGRLGEAEPLVREAARVLRAAGFVDGACFADMQLGRLLVGRGEAVEGEALLDRAQRELEDVGVAGMALEVAVHRAHCLVGRGEAEAAAALVERAVAAAGDDAAVLAAAVARLLATTFAAQGRNGEAEERLAEGLAAARTQGLPYEEALLLELQDQVDHRAGRVTDGAVAARIAEVHEQLGIVDAASSAPPVAVSGS